MLPACQKRYEEWWMGRCFGARLLKAVPGYAHTAEFH